MNELDIRDIKKFQRNKLHDYIVDQVQASEELPSVLKMTYKQFEILKPNLIEHDDPNSPLARLYITPYNAMDIIVDNPK